MKRKRQMLVVSIVVAACFFGSAAHAWELFTNINKFGRKVLVSTEGEEQAGSLGTDAGFVTSVVASEGSDACTIRYESPDSQGEFGCEVVGLSPNALLQCQIAAAALGSQKLVEFLYVVKEGSEGQKVHVVKEVRYFNVTE